MIWVAEDYGRKWVRFRVPVGVVAVGVWGEIHVGIGRGAAGYLGPSSLPPLLPKPRLPDHLPTLQAG